MFIGAASITAGVVWKPVDWVLTVLGAALAVTGVWNLRAPRPAVVFVDAFILILAGAYNVLSAVIKMVDGLPPSPVRAILGLLQILWGIRGFRKVWSAFQGASFDDEKQALNQLVGTIRQVASSDVAGMLEFTSGGFRRRVWKARIEGDRVVFMETRGPGRLIGTRETLMIRARAPKDPKAPREAEISVGATRIRTKITPEALRTLAEWKAGRSTRKAA